MCLQIKKSIQYVFIQKDFNLQQKRWLENLEYFDMRFLYHPVKVNMVADVVSRMFMISVTHINGEKKELVRDVARFA